MPFAAISELPKAVRDRLTDTKQRQWMAVFNSVFADTENEGKAFAAANAAVKKHKGVSVDFTHSCEIAKLDDELRIVWGWAYVCEEGGVQSVDHSGQVAAPLEIQKAAHGFVTHSRVGGEMHETEAGYIVDSIFFSAEIQKALGIDLGKVGWFIGMRVTDDDAWQGVKDGTYQAFSIAGSADTEAIE